MWMIKKKRKKCKGKNILLFLDEKKQKSSDCTELAKNILLRLKSFNSAAILKDFHALIIYFLNANSVNVGEGFPNWWE
jgi:hypothetical protein